MLERACEKLRVVFLHSDVGYDPTIEILEQICRVDKLTSLQLLTVQQLGYIKVLCDIDLRWTKKRASYSLVRLPGNLCQEVEAEVCWCRRIR